MIKTDQLTKRYESLTAVDAVTFQVTPGEVLGFLGPNGAGKTTTMRMLAGFITPTAGSASICGHDVVADPLAAKAALGYLPEGAPLYGEMTVRGFLEFVADLRALEGERRRTRLAHVIEHLQLGAVLEQTIETLSKGFRRRVGLAQAIVHDPLLLILDEPTSGLDPEERQMLLNRIRLLSRDQGKAVLICTHILPDVQFISDSVVILARGRVQVSQRLAELSRPATPALEVRLLGSSDRFIDLIRGRGIGVTLQSNGKLVLKGAPEELAGQVWHTANECGVGVRSLTPSQNSLEEIFLKAVREEPQID
jgi:ABC-2 type transport system ATP-binding protein